MSVNQLRITRPDDWHLHLRDGPVLAHLVADTASSFARAIIMPNLSPPVTTVAQALAYRDRILAACPRDSVFEPLMTLYLTDDTQPEEIVRAANCEHVHALKLYPAGATTNSAAGVTDLDRVAGALEAMEKYDLPLLIHGEVVGEEIDVFDREAIFIETKLCRLADQFPALRMVLEHITTQEGGDLVSQARDGVAGTITPHHLLINRNALFSGGMRPHHYCLPVAKRERHRQALLRAATSGNPRFFLGTDSAPHPKSAKESHCGCAGIYVAHAAIELYAEAFDSVGALSKLEAFASFHGPDFYGLERNSDHLILERTVWDVPPVLPFGDGELVPFRAGESVSWRIMS